MGKIGPHTKLAKNTTPDGEKTQTDGTTVPNYTTPRLLSPAEQWGREKQSEILAKEMAKKKLAKPASAKYSTARQSRQNRALSAPQKNTKGTRVGITKLTQKSPTNRVASTSASASRPTTTNTSVNSTPRQQQGAGKRKSQIPTRIPHKFESPNRFDALGDSDEEGETTASPDVNPPPQQTPPGDTPAAFTATSHDDNSTPAVAGQQQPTDSGEDETNPRNVPPILVYQLEGPMNVRRPYPAGKRRKTTGTAAATERRPHLAERPTGTTPQKESSGKQHPLHPLRRTKQLKPTPHKSRMVGGRKALFDGEEEDIEMPKAQQRRKPPPIVIKFDEHFRELQNAISLCIGKDNYTVRVTGDELFKICTKTSEDYQKVSQLVQDKKWSHYTFSPLRTKPLKVVFRHLPRTILPSEVKEDLENMGFVVEEVVRMRPFRTRRRGPLMLVTASNTTRNRQLSSLTKIGNVEVKAEELRNKAAYAQYYRCLEPGHVRQSSAAPPTALPRRQVAPTTAPPQQQAPHPAATQRVADQSARAARLRRHAQRTNHRQPLVTWRAPRTSRSQDGGVPQRPAILLAPDKIANKRRPTRAMLQSGATAGTKNPRARRGRRGGKKQSPSYRGNSAPQPAPRQKQAPAMPQNGGRAPPAAAITAQGPADGQSRKQVAPPSAPSQSPAAPPSAPIRAQEAPPTAPSQWGASSPPAPSSAQDNMADFPALRPRPGRRPDNAQTAVRHPVGNSNGAPTIVPHAKAMSGSQQNERPDSLGNYCAFFERMFGLMEKLMTRVLDAISEIPARMTAAVNQAIQANFQQQQHGGAAARN
ncbi:uncharacterized protein LOC126101478 [Schistocerca cancellata]|uniref:uncharacterized protein LOC126101478 n=1 Tax=Schistocerca cancellata TaxID=274614 RepID=UPI00211867E8|nr:uncharacterized protein LOC126101478 [Schistocerca cancellata]